jgi:hypothetical protein
MREHTGQTLAADCVHLLTFLTLADGSEDRQGARAQNRQQHSRQRTLDADVDAREHSALQSREKPARGQWHVVLARTET